MASASLFASASYIWDTSDGRKRNQYLLFRRSMVLEEQPRKATLHLFADTRYRLLINGLTIAHGPARFYPEYPQYDSHDI